MSDMTRQEKIKFESLLEMSSGYVLDFSNRTFREFIEDSTGRSIYDIGYDPEGGSKATRLRRFWNQEPNQIVGKLMGDLLNYGVENNLFKNDKQPLLVACRQTVARLSQDTPVPEINVLIPNTKGKDFEVVAKQAREAIEKNQPEIGLDRLHTFVIKYVRTLCDQRRITTLRDKPLHSLFGEYVKDLTSQGHIESIMTRRILKASISILEAFNEVRNERSLAHDNPILNYDESLLIYNHVTSSIRFIRALELRIRDRERKQEKPPDITDDILKIITAFE